ncbi:MAG: hypothetical protein M3203_00440, partial [Actinomycetota bacterium]|nr:hypothetical protein [Actinomycetota bacterium]
AICYLVGLAYGSVFGSRSKLPPVTFDRPVSSIPPTLARRARWAAALGVVALVVSFKLLGYIPLLAADRVSAKYGVGPYRAGFARGSLAFHVALAIASAILPVVLVMAYRHRRRLDIALGALLMVGLLVTLSRHQAFVGPLLFLTVIAIERRWRPLCILAVVCFAFVAGTFVNEVVLRTPAPAGGNFASRVLESTPDVREHLYFLTGFETGGERFIGTKTMQAGLSLSRDKGEFDPSRYAVRTITGFSDVNDFASGGARLPAPVWGYASFGYAGAGAWAFLYGIFIGWGTTTIRRLVAPVQRSRGQSMNLVLAGVFYSGTFGLLASFYFPQRANVILFLLAVALCISLPRRPEAPITPTAHDSGSRQLIQQ